MSRAGADWADVERWFLELLELEIPERAAALARLEVEQPEVAVEVRSLLAAHELESPLPAHLTDEHAAPPQQVGPYHVVRELGHGGMGVVYLAEREGEGFVQRVALKLLRGRFPDRGADERSASERRILARLEHPGIARLIDGGRTSDGQPFLAMEYVEGVTLLDFARRWDLGVPERLKLFAEVCDAVQYAHQQLVVHRDLKPGNIIVGVDGRPRLLDFGIAKLLAGDEDDAGGALTRSSPWLTPAYASPEQVQGRAVGTLSDVYSLGVLLFELLAEVRPYDLSGASPTEVERVVCHDVPPRASERAPDPRRARELRGDLDVVVATALEKEPARRYPSAQALADDIRRYLEGHPIVARPATMAYRWRKFVMRHRGAVAATAVVMVAVGAGMAGVIWQSRRAAEQAEIAEAQRDVAAAEARKAERVASVLVDLFRLSDPSQSRGDTVTAREVLERGAERIEREFRDEPGMQAALLVELARVHTNLGMLGRAEALLQRALSLQEGLGPPGDARLLAELGRVLALAGRRDEAAEVLRRGIAMRGEQAVERDTVLAAMQAELGWIVRAAGAHDSAAVLFSAALEAQRAAVGDTAPATASALLGLAAAEHDRGRFDEAEQLFREALARLDTSRGRPHPMAATALLNTGMIRRLREQHRESTPLLEGSYAMALQLYDAGHPSRLEATAQWGLQLYDVGRYREAERVLASGLVEAEGALGHRHPITGTLREGLATVLVATGRFAEAVRRFDEGLVVRRARHAGDHPEIVAALVRRGDALVSAGRLAEAEATLREAQAMAERLSTEPSIYTALAQQAMARASRERGRLADAERSLNAALAVAEARLRPDHRYRLSMQRELALLHLARGDVDRAEGLLRRLLPAEERAVPAPHPRVGQVLQGLAEAAIARGDPQAAARRIEEARSHYRELPESHPRVRELRALAAKVQREAEAPASAVGDSSRAG